ncbi:hypothetical protein [Ammoniphilus resinae]|uniref:Uncharacterized protein n=1 Tax=Ammoniphilus resinae TaxID=861532 RepID=A0ABS4GK46_9BACL|nr:hypothetical protein [Ammoniphilus resinae]MBP1930633.1 hypothetical protein [Ammoniphilus resinae]
MTLIDALSNWTQLKLVVNSRPNDEAAIISLDHVADILKEEFEIVPTSLEKVEALYLVTFNEKGVEKTQTFPAQVAETLLQFINENPDRYEFK